jgi:sec-independent protein translocase protein TatA
MFGIGTQELIFIILVVLLFFGGKKIPELMKGLGKGVRSFKEGMNGIENPSVSDEKAKESVSKTDVVHNDETKETSKNDTLK